VEHSKLDPRTKLIVLFTFSWFVSLSNNFKSLLFYGIFALFWLFFYRLNPLKVLKSLLPANGFLVFVVLTMLITYTEKPLEERFLYGLLLFLKSNEILFLTYTVFKTSDPFEIFHALHHMRFPSKLVLLMFFTYRYLFTLQREYQNLLKSAKCRGFKFKTSSRTYKTFVYLVANLIYKSYLLSEQVYKALLARGFKGYFPVYRHFKFGKTDFWILVFSLLYLVLVFIET
jgi:cobalt/nickel transport system permease protein